MKSTQRKASKEVQNQKKAKVFELPAAKHASFLSYKNVCDSHIEWCMKLLDEMQVQAQQQHYAAQIASQNSSLIYTNSLLFIGKLEGFFESLEHFRDNGDLKVALDVLKKIETGVEFIKSQTDVASNSLNIVNSHAQAGYGINRSCANLIDFINSYKSLAEELLSLSEDESLTKEELSDIKKFVDSVKENSEKSIRTGHFVQSIVNGIENLSLSTSNTLSECNKSLDDLISRMIMAKQSLAMD